jgi:adaptin ear-binding coat-associated protein 1/2
MDDDYERTLLQLPHVMVFKIPTLKTSAGHRAADWPTTPVWSGKLKIVEKKQVAVIALIDEHNQTFAVCPVTDDAAVDRTVDSGRYFILRIENAQGKRAFIGIAFNERNDAFDFNVALSEHKAQKEREKQAMDFFDTPTAALKDLSLKEGEKVKINIASSTVSMFAATGKVPLSFVNNIVHVPGKETRKGDDRWKWSSSSSGSKGHSSTTSIEYWYLIASFNCNIFVGI